jgi:lipoprotein-releasing system ATP-binding protein
MLEVQSLHKRYGQLEVLKGVDLFIDRSEIVSVVGASGAGKSTLLHILGTLDHPDEGKVAFMGEDPFKLRKNSLARFRNEKIGFIFQFHNLLPEFTAIENVMMPSLIAGRSSPEAKESGMELLKILDVEARATHRPAELSGGEQQRVAVARALINKPEIVFADEPSGNLDSNNAERLHEIFFELRDRFGYTFVIVTHNESLATMADRKLEIQDGKILND